MLLKDSERAAVIAAVAALNRAAERARVDTATSVEDHRRALYLRATIENVLVLSGEFQLGDFRG